MSITALLLTEFKYRWIFQRRYLFNYISGTVNLLLFILFLQLGLNSFQSHMSQDYIEGKMNMLIIGFFVFTMIASSISAISGAISEGASTGTLEQVMLSPYGASTVFLCKAVASSAYNFIYYLLIIPLSMLLCRHFFYVDIPRLLILIVPLCLSSWGIGFALGAATMVYKQTSSFTNLVQFLVLSLMVVPSCPFNVFSLFPVAPEAMTINKVIAGTMVIDPIWLLFLYIHGFIYLMAGMLVFKFGETHAREKGILGQY